MGWYLRKSIRMGPVRWNLSKSGIGMSAGVRGLRVGTGPRGAYIAGGRGGIYFRQRIGAPTRRLSPGAQAAPRQYRVGSTPSAPYRGQAPTPTAPLASTAPMEYLPETDVAQFTPSTADALAQYIIAQRSHTAWFPLATIGLVLLNMLILAYVWPLAILTAPLSVYAGYYLYHSDRQRTHVALHYDLDGAEGQQFEQLCAGLATLAGTARLQRVEARQFHGDWKHQAGASTALKLAPSAVTPPGRMRWLETNVPVWSVVWRQGGVALSFLPDRVIVEQRRAVAVVPYSDLHVSYTLGRFVEGGRVPPDAHILGYNWQYTNKNGTRDRRFNNNRQLPVVEAVYIALQSASGLNLLLQGSNRQRAEGFIGSLQRYHPLVCAEMGASA